MRKQAPKGQGARYGWQQGRGLASQDLSRAGWGQLRVQTARQVSGDEANPRTSQGGASLLVKDQQCP